MLEVLGLRVTDSWLEAEPSEAGVCDSPLPCSKGSEGNPGESWIGSLSRPSSLKLLLVSSLSFGENTDSEHMALDFLESRKMFKVQNCYVWHLK